ncbi:ester cyclase [Streptomyces sp. B8F3]|uniref:ester cyclase n=1 Tax=unclassified Streptomyces TaxID=2593676 RepID=UPI00325C8255
MGQRFSAPPRHARRRRQVTVRLEFKGHFTGGYDGVRGRGREAGFIAMDVQRVGTERITEDWHLEDNLTFQQQIGAVNGPGTGEAV